MPYQWPLVRKFRSIWPSNLLHDGYLPLFPSTLACIKHPTFVHLPTFFSMGFTKGIHKGSLTSKFLRPGDCWSSITWEVVRKSEKKMWLTFKWHVWHGLSPDWNDQTITIIRAITFRSDLIQQYVGFNTWEDLKIGLHIFVWRSIWIHFSKWDIICYTDFVR